MSKTRLLAIGLIMSCISASWAQSPFPLPVPQRPDSFPLPLPQRSTNLVGELVSLGELQVGGSVETKAVSLFGGATNAVAVASTRLCAFAVLQNGELRAWAGLPTVYSTHPLPPIELPEGINDTAKVFTVGDTGAIALKSDGTLEAWGFVQVWNGGSSTAPLTVPSDANDIHDLAATAYGVYALKRDGSVVCWGTQYDHGVDGYSPFPPATFPDASTDVVAIAASFTHRLALKRDGTVVAGGVVASFGNVPDVVSPLLPNVLTNVVGIAAANDLSAFLLEDGKVVSWGYHPDESGNWRIPIETPANLPTIVRIKASDTAIFALSADGQIFSWPPPSYFPTQSLVEQINEIGSVVDFSVDGWGASIISARRGAAAQYAVKSLGIPVDSLASLIAERVLAKLPDNYGIATKADLGGAISSATAQAISEVQASPNDYNLFSATQHQANFDAGVTQGVNTVTSSPNTWSLYTVDQIKNMALGDLMLTKNINGKWVLNYDIEQSPDLVNWTPYAVKAEELTGLPTNKAFIRIRLKQ